MDRKTKFFKSYVNELRKLSEEVTLLRWVGRNNNFKDTNYIIHQYDEELCDLLKNQPNICRVIQRLADKDVLVQYEQGRYFKEGITQIKKVNGNTLKGVAGEYRTNYSKAKILVNQYLELCNLAIKISMYMSNFINLTDSDIYKLQLCDVDTTNITTNKLLTYNNYIKYKSIKYLSSFLYIDILDRYITNNNLFITFNSTYTNQLIHSIISNADLHQLENKNRSNPLNFGVSSTKNFENSLKKKKIAKGLADKMVTQLQKIKAVVSLDLDIIPDDAMPEWLVWRKWTFNQDFSVQKQYTATKRIANPSRVLVTDKELTYADVLGSYQAELPWVTELQKRVDEANLNNHPLLKYKFKANVKSYVPSTFKEKQAVWDGKAGKKGIKNVATRLTSPFCQTGNDIEHTDKVYPDEAYLRSAALKDMWGKEVEEIGCYDINASVHRLTKSFYNGRYISTKEIPDMYALLAGKDVLDRTPNKDGLSERDAWKQYFNMLYYCWVYGASGTNKSISNFYEAQVHHENWILNNLEYVSNVAAEQAKLKERLKKDKLARMVRFNVSCREGGVPVPTIKADRDKMCEVYDGEPLWVYVFAIESFVMWEVSMSLMRQGYDTAICYDCIYTDKPLAKTEEEANAKFEEELAKAFDIVYQQIKVEEE